MRRSTRWKIAFITGCGAVMMLSPEPAAARMDPTCIAACCICVDPGECQQNPYALCELGCGAGSQPVTGVCRHDDECSGSLELLECTVV